MLSAIAVLSYAVAWVSVVVLVLAPDAGAATMLLRGSYFAQTLRTCVQSESGFDSQGKLLAPGTVSTALDVGTIVFDGRGGGTFSGRSLVIQHDSKAPGQIPAVETEFNCNFTYSELSDRTTATMEMICAGMVGSGPGDGTSSSTSGIKGKWRILESGQLLVSMETAANVETVAFGDSRVSKRVCQRHGSGRKMPR